MVFKHKLVIRTLAGVLVSAAAVAVLPVAATSGIANADPGIGRGAPGPGIRPNPGGIGGPHSGLGVLPGPGLGLPGVGRGGFGGPHSGLGVLPGRGWGLPGPGLL